VNEEVDIFVFDRLTGQNEIVTVNSTTEQAIGHQFPVGGPNLAISSDGRFVAFFSSAENLDLRDNNGVLDLFVRDRLYQTTRRVLVPRKADSPHELYVGNEISLTITSDGQEVLFGSEADWLVPEDSNSSLDFFTVHQNQQAYFQIQVVIDPSWRLYLPIMFR
jgi:hypothetical protein